MKRVFTYLTVIVFVLGMLVLPAIHSITGCDGGNSPGGTCAICKLSHMPMEDAPAQTACLDLQFLSFLRIVPPLPAERAVTPRDVKQPRAPPVQG